MNRSNHVSVTIPDPAIWVSIDPISVHSECYLMSTLDLLYWFNKDKVIQICNFVLNKLKYSFIYYRGLRKCAWDSRILLNLCLKSLISTPRYKACIQWQTTESWLLVILHRSFFTFHSVDSDVTTSLTDLYSLGMKLLPNWTQCEHQIVSVFPNEDLLICSMH